MISDESKSKIVSDDKMEEHIDQEALRLSRGNPALWFHYHALFTGEWRVAQRGTQHYNSLLKTYKLAQHSKVEESVIQGWGIWHYLRDRANPESKTWPEQRTIAKEMACNTHSLKAWTKQLIAAGYLRAEKVGQNHHWKYTVLNGDGELHKQATPRVAENNNAKTSDCGNQQRRVLHKQATPRVAQSSNVSNYIEVNSKSNSAPSGAEHQVFIQGWSEKFQAHFRQPYKFQGGKDASAVKRLLQASKLPADELLRIAEQAWSRPTEFNCKQAISIAGFDSRFNEIRGELDAKVMKATEKGGLDIRNSL